MKIFKYFFIIVLLFILLLFLYRNFIFYMVPYNPLEKFSEEIPQAFDFEEYHSNDNKYKHKTSTDLNTNKLIFDYLIELKLIPVELDRIEEGFDTDVRFSGIFTLDGSKQERIFIKDIFLDDLTILNISSNIPDFQSKAGYYKIIDEKFDYKYIYDVMNNIED